MYYKTTNGHYSNNKDMRNIVSNSHEETKHETKHLPVGHPRSRMKKRKNKNREDLSTIATELTVQARTIPLSAPVNSVPRSWI